MEGTFDLADVERLAATLDAVDLDERDRATLHAVFALAGQAVATHNEEAEVSGYAMQAYMNFTGQKQGQIKSQVTSPGQTPLGGVHLFDSFVNPIDFQNGPNA